MTNNLGKKFCIAPWVHTHIWPDGTVYPCCMSNVERGNDFGNINDNTMQDIWNNEKYRQFRLDLINGVERPDVCYRCYALEETDKVTLRHDLNKDFLNSSYDLVSDTKEDGSADMVLKYWDFRFNNICNLSCRTCGPQLSSSWVEDHNKLYKAVNKKFLTVDLNSDSYTTLVQDQIDNVESIYFAGGEPLLMPEHHYILSMLEQKEKYELRLLYSTNATTLSYKKTYFPDIWKKFKQVNIMISLDEIYERAEYWRNGTKWQTLHNNIVKLVDFAKQNYNIRITFNPTICMFNVHRLKEYFTYLNEHDFLSNKDLRVNFNILIDPLYFNIQSLPDDYKLFIHESINDCEQYFNSLNKSSILPPSSFDILRTWLNEVDRNSIKNLEHGARILARIDKIRNQKLELVAPEIYNLYKDYGYDNYYDSFNISK